MIVVVPLVLVIAVDDLGGCGRDNNTIDLELSRPLSRLLLKVHPLDVVLRIQGDQIQ